MKQPNLSQKSLLQQPKINKFRILQQTILQHFICKTYLITLNISIFTKLLAILKMNINRI